MPVLTVEYERSFKLQCKQHPTMGVLAGPGYSSVLYQALGLTIPKWSMPYELYRGTLLWSKQK